MPTKQSDVRLLGVLFVAVTLCSCSTDGGVDAQGPVSPAPSSLAGSSAVSPLPTATASTTTSLSTAEFPDQAAILTQYRAFFAALTPASLLAEGPRSELLGGLAVDPLLTRVLGGMATSTSQGEVSYGEILVYPKLQSVHGDTAALTDCQDGSRSGRMKAATGEKTTVGSDHDFADVTLKRGADGVWRLATVAYRAEASCSAGS